MGRAPAEVERLLRDGAETRIAIVGASRARSKYGNIIVRDLVHLGYTVLPVNPGEVEVEGLACHATVAAAPPPVHIVDFVVPPDRTLEVLRALDPTQTPIVWLQPGSFDDACLAYARPRFPIVLEGDCIMVVARWFR